MDTLPLEINMMIAERLDLISKLVIRFTCWAWYNLLPSPGGRKRRKIRYKVMKASLELVKWLHSMNFFPNCRSSLRSNNKEIIEWIHDELPCVCSPDDVQGLIYSGSTISLEFLENKFPLGDVMYMATSEASLPSLRWGREKGYTWCPSYWEGIIYSENKDLITYASEHLPGKERGIVYAAQAGNLEMITYLRSQGFPWHPKAMIKALKNNDLKIAKYLINHSCPYNLHRCYKAGNGSWLLSNA